MVYLKNYLVLISRLFIVLFCLFSFGATSQTVIFGSIKSIDKLPLNQADVFLKNASGEVILETQSNEQGNFIAEINPEIKNFSLVVEYFGYDIYEEQIQVIDQEPIRRNILISIEKGFLQKPIVITQTIDSSMSHSFNSIRIDKNAVTLAASFDDPVRALYRYPGISTTNDQANGVQFRGIPSDFTKWSIYNAEIINPNHLSNAGRFNDFRSSSSGGVLAIPYDAIGVLDFYTEPNKASIPTSISGLMNLNFEDDGDRYVKVGLIGLEAAYSTPNKKLSANARYSTVGLLGKLGVDLGDEVIDYQDVFLKYKLSPQLELINIFGTSHNVHSNIDIAVAENSKDLKQVDYASRINIHGLRFVNDSHEHSLFYSSRFDNKSSKIVAPEFANVLSYPTDNYQTSESKISLSSEYQLAKHFNLKGLSLGINSNYSFIDFNIDEAFANLKYSFLEVKPFLSYSQTFSLTDNNYLSIRPIVAYHFDDYTSMSEFEPSLSLEYNTGNHFVTVDFSYKSQMPDPLFETLKLEERFNQRNRARSYSLSWKHLSNKDQIIMARFFYHDFINIPFASFYLESITDRFTAPFLFDTNRKGMDLLYSKKFEGEWFININGSINFDENDSSESLVNATFAKTWKFKKNSLQLMTSGIRRFYRFIGDRGQEFFRIDLRIAYSIKSKSSIILDVQNVTNARNIAYSYYDPYNNQYIEQVLLGTIPVISYKRSF